MSAIEAGLVDLPGTLVMLVVSAATGTVGTRVAARTLIVAGLLLVGIGQLMLTAVGTDTSWIVIMPGLLVAMVGTRLFNPAVTAVALGSVSGDQSGLAAGVNDTFRQGGIALGVAMLGALVPAQAAFGGGSAAAYVDGLHNAFYLGGAIAIVGAIAAGILIRGVFATATREHGGAAGSTPLVPATELV